VFDSRFRKCGAGPTRVDVHRVKGGLACIPLSLRLLKGTLLLPCGVESTVVQLSVVSSACSRAAGRNRKCDVLTLVRFRMW
jgi:hypothetical protein